MRSGNAQAGILQGDPSGRVQCGPPFVFVTEGSAQLNRIHAQAIEHVFVDDGQLLDGIVDVDGARLEAESGSELGIGDGGDAR